MSGQQLRCRLCKARFRRPKGSRRINCEMCRPPRVRGGAVVEPIEPPDPAEPGPIEVAARRELAAVGRAETVEGVLVLHLARQLDAGRHTGSQTAALVARLMDTKAAAVRGAGPAERDLVDELEARRAAKAASA